ncbi:hypothetical protein KM043_002583 [Ampulex compressa]|nr:hypothetical protein KM043_002583 [Ampulex compressa]
MSKRWLRCNFPSVDVIKANKPPNCSPASLLPAPDEDRWDLRRNFGPEFFPLGEVLAKFPHRGLRLTIRRPRRALFGAALAAGNRVEGPNLSEEIREEDERRELSAHRERPNSGEKEAHGLSMEMYERILKQIAAT